MDSEFNINLIAGTSLEHRVCAWTKEVAFRNSLATIARLALKGNPLQPWLGQSLFGSANPFFGMKHGQLSKDSMSRTKGTGIYVYTIDIDSVLTPAFGW